MDMTNNFFHNHNDNKIYVDQTEGYEKRENPVCMFVWIETIWLLLEQDFALVCNWKQL